MEKTWVFLFLAGAVLGAIYAVLFGQTQVPNLAIMICMAIAGLLAWLAVKIVNEDAIEKIIFDLFIGSLALGGVSGAIGSWNSLTTQGNIEWVLALLLLPIYGTMNALAAGGSFILGFVIGAGAYGAFSRPFSFPEHSPNKKLE